MESKAAGGRGTSQHHQRHLVAAWHRCAVALNQPTLPALERLRCVWESVATALAETMAQSGHYEIDSTTVRAHVSAAGDQSPSTSRRRADRKSHDTLIAGGRQEPSSPTRPMIPMQSAGPQAARHSRCHPAEIEPPSPDDMTKLVDSFFGMLYLATARHWIKFVHAT